MGHRAKRAVLIAAALSLFAMRAEAQDITGNHIIELCESASASDLALCHGFFRGLSDTHSIYAAMGKGLHLYCLPRGVTQEQFERVAFKWMEAHPEYLDRPAAVLIVEALHEGFPCDEKGEPVLDTERSEIREAPEEPDQAGGDPGESTDGG